MARHTATVSWERAGRPFTVDGYSRAHEWHFDGGQVVAASASPHIVPEPLSAAANVDPEEAFVAALSSCHMLFFLSLAAERGVVVDRYVDRAEGVLRRDSEGRLAMTDVTLRPDVKFGGEPPAADVVAALHEAAHERCFIANSVRTNVWVEPAG